MTRELPIVCSLEPGDLEQRLAEVGEIGAEALLDRRVEGETHVLRFRLTSDVRRRLEAVVAAEAQCCAFLDLSLVVRREELVLAISAPGAGQPTADALAAAFDASPAQGRT